ncbi:Threonine-phosphate decarboxylase [Zhongshania aliphaticivorans]|uniref:Aminotransferase n=1 Tax=Zhongshania aliphaticivorans TaxID=1470434 RepID=A0A5S9QBC6_9GAMM|nr:aminotransferase class I/II-fold pyridoxal phosphate-dependent enzyme [Zhongshania aliphaticivorans]CAA0087534.1 Threonine-phosphate decarboxylase [Zhongshania aliphaticivorans]CAA0115065.1 Threonine-phosphate decarboxylase [Zhongshania aliphaticivorans]CAA0119882.1 Threonine-phosphate decarboxylase [Zhongshania aliphaticivorans]
MDIPKHGGDPIGLPDTGSNAPMLDLATGVNPWVWPVPTPPIECYGKLPYFSEALQQAAAQYYGVAAEHILATAGSQPVIQLLPSLASKGRVLLPAVGYEEHRFRWQLAGHNVFRFECYGRDVIAEHICRDSITHLVLISPNNPSTHQVTVDDLIYWRTLLPDNGMLVVDQAFADANPESDVSALAGEQGIVLLRSVGKFFGLPGLRLGFVLAHSQLLAELDRQLGPWAVSGPAQWIGQRALVDDNWQQQMLKTLQCTSTAQAEILAATFRDSDVRCLKSGLFISLVMPLEKAKRLQLACYQVGLSVRVYHCGGEGYMRWGLAKDSDELARRLSLLDPNLLAA